MIYERMGIVDNYSNEEKSRLSKLGEEYKKRIKAFKKSAGDRLSDDLKKFAADNTTYYRNEGRSELYKEMQSGLCSGKYKAPSEFFKQNAEDLFKGWINPSRKEMFYYTIDHLHEWIYSSSYYRRSFRTINGKVIARNVLCIMNSFAEDDDVDMDICDILEEKYPEEIIGYKMHNHRYMGTNEFMGYAIAYEIDNGNERIIDIIKDAINNESNVPVTNTLLRAIVRSHCHELHVLVGKLLEAARLQEGLRQAICETMDSGNKEAFITLLEVIYKNGYIRYSSVKRAVATWLGLINDEASKLEHISEKSIELVYAVMKNPEIREEYLSSEDSMKIHIALWSYGFYEVEDMIKKIHKISESGTRHQVLTASYIAMQLDNPSLLHKMATRIIPEYIDDAEMMAVYLPCFMSDVYSNISCLFPYSYKIKPDDEVYKKKQYCELSKYFDDVETAEKYYKLLKVLYDSFKGKEVVYFPCIFPWHAAKLKRSDIIIRMAYISSSLRSDEKIDEICDILSNSDPDQRSYIVRLLLIQPQTELQRKTLISAMCDKSESTRKQAYCIVYNEELTGDDYACIEGMLKYKAADARANLISLLYRQSDDELYDSLSRLISDKKEEKRTAALDIVMQLSSDEKRKSLFGRCMEIVKNISAPTTKEQILIDNILGSAGSETTQEEKLFDECDVYAPTVPKNDFTQECIDLFMEYFPDSEIGSVLCPVKYRSVIKSIKKAVSDMSGECSSFKQAKSDFFALSKFIKEHEKDEFVGNDGEITIVGCSYADFNERKNDIRWNLPLYSLWKEWYEKNINSPQRLLRMYMIAIAYQETSIYTQSTEPFVRKLFGSGFETTVRCDYFAHAYKIVSNLKDEFVDKKDIEKLAISVALWYIESVDNKDILHKDEKNYRNDYPLVPLISQVQIAYFLSRLNCRNNDMAQIIMPLRVMICLKTRSDSEKSIISYGSFNTAYANHSSYYSGSRVSLPSIREQIVAAYRGIISEKELYHFLFESDRMSDSFEYLSMIIMAVREKDKQISVRGGYYSWRTRIKFSVLADLTDNKEILTEDDNRLVDFTVNIYHRIMNVVLAKELRRGDTNTEYSTSITGIKRIYGIENFISVISAMGNEKLERSSYWCGSSKKSCLSHLLSVCVPNDGDNAEKLKALVKNTDISEKRLIESAMYSPEWINIVSEYLDWDGFISSCYYFIAHMNESFDDHRKAVIARYTPLTDDELNHGAFDINWFRSAYETLGQKRFDMIYDAAKYISDGAKHSRARKYADAVLGKMEIDKTIETVSDKRNKDLLMALSLIPIKNEDDICKRYLYLQKFLKESKKFGAQRSASEKKAVEVSMQNLAMNAGYTDVTRLTLRMETKLIDDNKELFEEKEVEDIVIRLAVGEDGKIETIVSKNGKALKSIPAKLKKNEYILRINETKKNLTEQYRRTKIMFEQAMEDRTGFTACEIEILKDNPVVNPIIKNLVFVHENILGFLNGNKLTDFKGNVKKLAENDTLTVAHPLDLYNDGNWSGYQKYLFDNGIVQHFKQVFRELYVKTDEERECNDSRRYSGNQIQPTKTVACLKSRRWVADIEDGLQKIYYRENIVARIYAITDWFSPADIEAPTLEWVEFFDRKTGKSIKINDVPDIIFSEVMRDVDMAVSVAHAGGVDPETSHSTIEMRSAIIEFTLPLFKLTNVKLEKNHAHIEGKYGNYSVHLGSGVVHKMGGTMINILPVHSQHRGKLFLPFADEDPKTAEILTKILFLSEDDKIKDPSIVEQIRNL